MNSKVLIMIATILVLSNAQDSRRTYCPKDRQGGNACAEIYQPVCGVPIPGKIMCIKAPCVLQYSNGCEACNDLNIQHFIQGECNSIDFSVEYCEAQERGDVMCTMEYTPTCGFSADGQTKKEYSNKCVACSNKEVDYVKRDKCPQETSAPEPIDSSKIICQSKERNVEFCTMEYIQTCGYQNGGKSWQTYGNRCTACTNTDVEYIVFAPCPSSDSVTTNQIPSVPVNNDLGNNDVSSLGVCSAEEKKAQFCTKIYKPVCGYSGKDNVKMQTYSNRCEACKLPQVYQVADSQCSKTTNSTETTNNSQELCPKDIMFKCSSQWIPVCATFQKCETSSKCQETQTNYCIACSDSNVLSVQNGECQQVSLTNEYNSTISVSSSELLTVIGVTFILALLF